MYSDKLFCKLYIAIMLIMMAACSSALYIPDERSVSASASLEELTAGRKLYVDHCGSCHALHLPASYSHEQWKEQVDEMEVRAHINTSEKELILKYLWNAPVVSN
jgi:mono/diheme cytochrome c family protein